MRGLARSHRLVTWLRPPRLLPLLLMCVSLGLVAQAKVGPAWPPDLALHQFPECDSLRATLYDSLLHASRSQVLAYKQRDYRANGNPFRVRVESGATSFSVVIDSGRSMGDKGPVVYHPQGQGQGSWTVVRSMADGSYSFARVFLRSAGSAYLDIYPFADRCKADFVVEGAVLNSGMVINQSFEDALILPVSRLLDLLAPSMDVSLLAVEPGLYSASLSMIEKIRAQLSHLEYSQDGFIGGDGRALGQGSQDQVMARRGRIALNCSGFAKWIVDGLYVAAPGPGAPAELIPIGPLVSYDTELRGNSFSEAFEFSRDPYFGLDWIRNLSMALYGRLYPNRQLDKLGQDLRMDCFTRLLDSQAKPFVRPSVSGYPGFLNDSGYQVRGLRALMYLLAHREPGHFYLGAFNREYGSSPSLRQFFHIAAFFPYFDGDKVFRVAVFESCEETSLTKVEARGGGKECVYLVRFPCDADFLPDLALGKGP